MPLEFQYDESERCHDAVASSWLSDLDNYYRILLGPDHEKPFLLIGPRNLHEHHATLAAAFQSANDHDSCILRAAQLADSKAWHEQERAEHGHYCF